MLSPCSGRGGAQDAAEKARGRGPHSSAGRNRVRARKRKKDGAGEISDALKNRLFDLRKRGFNRLYQNGQIFEFSTPESLLDVDFSQPVFVLVDRLAFRLKPVAHRRRHRDGLPRVGRSYF